MCIYTNKIITLTTGSVLNFDTEYVSGIGTMELPGINTKRSCRMANGAKLQKSMKFDTSISSLSVR